MSAVEGDGTQRHTGSPAPMPPPAPASDSTDVPGILAGQVAELYADSERERRSASLERAISRARDTA